MSKSWDSGVLKKLKALVGKGLSTAEIGKRLGISKNAVVGKLHRMGWNATATDAPKETKKVVAKKTDSAKKVATKKAAPVKSVKSVKVSKPTKATKPSKPAARAATKTKAKPVAAPKVAKPKPEVKKTVGRAIAGKGTAAIHQRMVEHALEMANLKPNQCRWPIGDPDSEGFHFCGKTVFVGKPYCYEHCKQAYQFTAPKKK